MRRSFNKNILPTKAPPKGFQYKQVHNNTPFQIWFKEKLNKHTLSLKQFCELGDIKFNTAQCWRYKTEPTIMFRVDIAKVFSKLDKKPFKESLLEVCNECKNKHIKRAEYIAKHIKTGKKDHE